MKKFQDWAKREYSIRQRLIALGFEGIFFVMIFPFLLVVSSVAVDRWLQIPRFTLGAVNLIVGLLLVVGGGFLGLWSIQVLLTIGKGTPVPRGVKQIHGNKEENPMHPDYSIEQRCG